MSLRIVIIGAGEVGYNLAKVLANDECDLTIIDIDSKTIPAYYYVNNKYKLPDNYGRLIVKQVPKVWLSSPNEYRFTVPSEIYSDAKFVSSSGEDISITSNTYAISDETYYAVDLGGDDLFYVNDILVHS